MFWKLQENTYAAVWFQGYSPRGLRKLFHGGGGGGGGDWVKISATMVGRHSPKERNLNQNINDSKSYIWNSFFENVISAFFRVFS